MGDIAAPPSAATSRAAHPVPRRARASCSDPTARSRSMSAPRRSARGSKRSAPRLRRTRWKCAANDVEIDAGTVLGPDRQSLPLAAFAGTSAEAVYASNKRTYSYGAHAAHVAVDPKTGHVEL